MSIEDISLMLQFCYAREFRRQLIGLTGKKQRFRKCRECSCKLGKGQTRNPVCVECYKHNHKCLDKWLKVYDK